MVHDNSVIAYEEERSNLSKRAKQIYELFSFMRVPLTDRQVMQSLYFTEPNAVRPRITELIKEGLLQELGKTPCELTGKRVRMVGLAQVKTELQQGELF